MKGYKTLLLEPIAGFYLNENEEIIPLEHLPFTNKINILIGTNNSGKSKFMRKIMQLNNYSFLNEYAFSKINSLLADYAPFRKGVKILTRKHYKIKNDIEDQRLSGSFVRGDFPDDIFISVDRPKVYYIPTLRSAHSLYLETKTEQYNSYKYEKIEDDIFLHTLRKNYSLSESVDVFTGIHLYKDILNTRNSKRETRKKFENFERFISRNFFEGKTIDIIAEFDKDESRNGNNTKEIISIHIEGEKDSRDLFDLGDGIQALIILMYKIFMAEDNSYVFIDEPEINLHPGMQRMFLEQINSNPDLVKKNLTYFISTHSNHFLDLTLEKNNVSIYSFYSKVETDGEKKLIIKNVNTGDNEILKNIGVNNSSVFMANCSIWVEGISDRIYIKAFLQSYCKSLGKKFPKEDIDFAFFEYAGTNLEHYFFDENINSETQKEIISDIKAMALSNRIFLIADSDNAENDISMSKKKIRLKNLKEAKSNNFTPLVIEDYREIENLLPLDVWKTILIKFCNKNLVSEHREEIENKIEEVLKKFERKNYKKKYIGEFLNDVRNELGKISNKFILNESEYKKLPNDKFGTLTNKRWLSEIVAGKDFSWDVLKKSKGIEKLTIEIYSFITKK
ncbi:AAA family ATPase [Chryseobacterium sp. POL2]|uniref:ATP-dependent nuclease n=1 Tax=Chryseobacterium sp. POL2 TaxID=2713414 RepID=UPI0013E1A3CA|nr:AAA family ATPase [Chryseobacterium sp. POL2]QIG90674.1 AAA family ATPase [Chryseobacterium sp. POL2]